MHGREGDENRKRSQHMCSVPSSRTVAAVDSNGSSLNHFFKDGRKISVGDCALFKPPQASPPFIGLIHCLTSVEESNLTLSVNWLYRPAEVKLAKGVAPEAAPNEVFYSFHSDEIPAASLLHPCKVAFLPKGVKLPPGVSSFVCRRVYDITHKCLWWLTDKDYIDDRQKEVGKLLHKTSTEMHATAQQQQGTRSPKPLNGSAGTSPLTHSPDSMQNNSCNLSSLTKGKKRERGDQSSEPVKWERFLRADDVGSGQLRSESMLKLEIAKIAEKGLVDSETVERLVQLMQPENPERKIDLTGRSMLAGIIAATDKLDCLSQFVQLRGLPVLNEWLQEVHKGKIRDPGNVKDDDKTVEDFLLVLLRALDKLPINLNALQMCNIGKSVNHLRSHKNIEIQKKARILVDTWKKRVEAEMNVNDAKSGSSQAVAWPGRSRHDSPYGGNRHSSGSSETAIRSSVTHYSSLKTTSVKLVQGDSTSKSTSSAYPGGTRSALSPTSTTVNCKDGQSRMSANTASSEPPQAVVKEEKSSSSSQSQSHTNSQCSSDHAKNMVPSGKEDIRSSTAVSRSLNKMTGSGFKHQKSANDLQCTPTSGVQREPVPNRGTSVAKISVVEKVSDKVNAVDSSVHEANNHKLIVKIPNRSHSAAQNITVGAVEDSSCRNSRVSSPALSEKRDQSDTCLREKQDRLQSSVVNGSSTYVHHRTSDDIKRLRNAPKVASSPSRDDMKSRKALDSSFSSMNALVESCVKFSEANASMSTGGDVGMNLLASVAAGEIYKSATVSPCVSPSRNSAAAENCCDYNGSEKQLHAEGSVQHQCQSCNIADADKCSIVAGVSKVNDGVTNNHPGSSIEILHQNEEGCLKSNGKLDEQVGVTSLPSSPACTDNERSHNQLPVASQGLSSLAADNQVKDASLKEESEKKAHTDTLLYPSSNAYEEKNNGSLGVQISITSEQKSLAVALQPESRNTNEKNAVVSSSAGQELAAKSSNEVKPGKADGIDLCDHHAGCEDNRRIDKEIDPSPMPQKQEKSGLSSIDKVQNTSCKDENVENKEAEQIISSAVDQLKSEVHLSKKESGITAAEKEREDEDEDEPAIGNATLSPAAGGSDIGTKLGFDLNEGFSMDDGKSGDSSHLIASPCPATVSSASGGFPASITVAAAGKGPFVPPDDLLKSKPELRWKGSAATSAFRPAEPRKVVELPLGPSKQARPPLDIDLNVADERTNFDTGCQTSSLDSIDRNNPICELMTTASLRCSGGFDLDLNDLDPNEVDEAPYLGQFSASNGQRLEVSTPPIKASSSRIFSNAEASSRRDFDLNDGPATEEFPVEKTSYNQHGRSSVPPQGPFGPRINSTDSGNCFAWYPPGTSYSVSMTPSALPDRAFPIVGRGSGPQRVIGGPTSSLSFNPDSYRGSVLSSTAAMPFHTTAFQYPVFPFETAFPLPTSALLGGSSGFMDPAAGGRFSAVPSQLVGTAAAVPFQYPHAYVVSRPISDVGNNGVVESNQKWGKQGLDLNSGPRGVDAEGRDESLPTVPRQLPGISSQSLAEEQVRMYNMEGGVLKRKEPEGGWNMDKLNFKQSSWR